MKPVYFSIICATVAHPNSETISNPVEIGRKLNVNKTFIRHPGRLLNVLGAFSLRPVSTEKLRIKKDVHEHNHEFG